jgi:trk system potassium uptake protein TrkH
MSFIYLVITAFYPESKLRSMRGFISGRTLHMRELFGTITIIFSLYIVIVALLLWVFGGGNLMDNFSLAMSTLATGGFLPNSTILQDLVWQEEIVLMGAMILGALPFTFHYGFVRKKFLSPKLGKEVLVYFAILTTATLLFMAISGFDPLDSAFYSVSASTTAGLQQETLSGLNPVAHGILIILMFIGGCGFSTAGGLKIFRLFHLKNAKNMLSKVKRAQLPLEAKKEVYSTLIIVALFPIIALITAGHLAAIEDVSYENAFFESVGVITTGGLSAGVIDFDTDPATKVVLGFLMIFGRLEIIAIIYIFVPKLI